MSMIAMADRAQCGSGAGAAHSEWLRLKAALPGAELL